MLDEHILISVLMAFLIITLDKFWSLSIGCLFPRK